MPRQTIHQSASPPLPGLAMSTFEGTPSARTSATRLLYASSASDLFFRKHTHAWRENSSFAGMTCAAYPTEKGLYYGQIKSTTSSLNLFDARVLVRLGVCRRALTLMRASGAARLRCRSGVGWRAEQPVQCLSFPNSSTSCVSAVIRSNEHTHSRKRGCLQLYQYGLCYRRQAREPPEGISQADYTQSPGGWGSNGRTAHSRRLALSCKRIQSNYCRCGTF